MNAVRLVLLLLGLSAAAALPSAAQGTAPLRVGATANDTFAEAYYAADMGFFAKAGLNVDLQTYTNGATVAAAVASGAIDVGVSNVIQLATAVTHAIPFVVIAPAATYTPNAPATALCVAGNSPLRTAKDFEGKVIGVQGLSDMLAVSAKAWLTQNGADLSKVKFVEVTFSEMAPALARGTIAGAMISEPALAGAKNAGVRVFAASYDAIGKLFYTSGWFATQDWVAKHPDAAKRFAEAIFETARWANAHHDQSAGILAKYAKLDPEVARGMIRSAYGETFEPRYFQPPLDAAFKYKVLERAVSANELIGRK
jgi:NitT/TauT family transport system substrate-binding protein